MQTNRQIKMDRHKDLYTDRQASNDRQTNKYRQIDILTRHRHTKNQTNRQANRQIQTNRLTDRQTPRQTNKQTDKHWTLEREATA